MIRWTEAGAVTFPRTVQIRAQRRYPGRIRAGAPLPSRDLTPAELRENIRHFTAGMRTPRTAPCGALVLSGAGVAEREDLADAIRLARDEGVVHVTLHADVGDAAASPHLAGVDRLVVPVRPETVSGAAALVAAARAAGRDAVATVLLSSDALPALPAMIAALLAARPSQVVLTYPFPAGDAPTEGVPLPAAAVAALSAALPLLDRAGIRARVKGLPACFLGAQDRRLARTHNRWYVDAEHQGAAALLFFPGVIAFFKAEGCRFCAAEYRCDGFFEAYLSRAGVKPLRPVPQDLSDG